MLTPEQAFKKMLGAIKPLAKEKINLGQAANRILAETVKADRDIPAGNRSAMDGYALRASDLQKVPVELQVIGEVAAGSALKPKIKAGTCASIFTGANVPPGADTVVMIEKTRKIDKNKVCFLESAKRGQHILFKAENCRRHQVLLQPGIRLNAAAIGVCASVGKAVIKAYKNPGVSILCTGEELRKITDKVQTHEIRNSNGPTLKAALQTYGLQKISMNKVKDNAALIKHKIKKLCTGGEVLVITGGASVGKYDFVPAAIQTAGGKILFQKIAMKPGKPSIFALMPGGKLIFGLPGNPLSSLNTFFCFVLPAIRRLQGLALEQCRPSFPVCLAADAVNKGDRSRFLTVKLCWHKKGAVASLIKSMGSADLISAAKADGVISLKPGQQIKTGEIATFIPWATGTN